MKLSIVIPMYNVELYIEQCLLSCLKQDISKKDYEIIIVNDGSPDNSIQIAERIAGQANNIQIITQTNAGLSVARNTGLQYAKGDYVWFVDSDDSIKENCLGKLLTQCEHDKLDMLAVGAADIIQGKEVCRFTYPFKEVVTGKEVMNDGYMQHCVPFTIYRREFLLLYKLEFYPGIFHEDSEFSPRAYFHAKRVGFTNEIVYFVTINPNSITRTANYKKSFDCLEVAVSIHRYFEGISKGKICIFVHNYISLIINNSLANLTVKDNDNKKRKQAIDLFEKEIYINRYLFTHLRHSSILKYQIEGYLFGLLPKHTFFIYKILKSLTF